MEFKDFILGPLYLFVVFLLSSFFKKRLTKNDEEGKLYNRALLVKLIGVTFFALIYQFYYRGGDTMGFYAWSTNFIDYFFKDFGSALNFLFTDNEIAFNKFKYNYYASGYGYLLKYGSRETLFIKMSSMINIFALNSYLSTSYIFAFISFLGNWLLYKVFLDYYPSLKKALTYAVLFIPSVTFWGTGVLKDTITFAALGFLVYALYKAFVKKEKIIRNLFLIILASYFIMILKAYIFIAFLPAGVIWVFNERKAKIKSGALRAVLTPLFIVMIVATLSSLIVIVGESAGRFSISSLEQTTKDFQGWHKVASEDGSGYVINSSGTSIGALITAIPESVNVTYFRPYLWEAGSIVVFIGAVESLFLFLYFLKVFFINGKVFNFFRAILSKPVIQMCLIFAIFFGFVVGFTSFNFGALARYKIPSMPFFIAFLVMTSHQIDILDGKVKQS